MSNDSSQTQRLDEKGWQRAREVSLKRGLPPTQVPGYEFERCLGEGAYGEVWVAKDRNNPGRRVAIKFYTQRAGDWGPLAREVEKLNFLATDRYVVQLLDVGWNADPPYYVMEFMERGSLADRLQVGPMPVKEAEAMFREIARGVVNAHNRGVLHCDIKPANILLGPDGKPRLADFGQSRLSSEQRPALGTLFYMAPEQADLTAAPDARWDVYALGALFYCMVTGEPPYRDAPAAAALDEPVELAERLARYRRLLEDAPKPRKHRSCHGMDRALADIIDRCLAVNPTKRYPNVQSVINALEARSQRRARRPILVLGALAPALLLLLMGGMVAQELNTAVNAAEKSLTEVTRDSDHFAAEAVAEKVAAKIDRRWQILEDEANNPDLKERLLAARGKFADSPEHAALKALLDDRQKSRAEVAPRADIDPSAAWSVYDEKGYLLARNPSSPKSNDNIGKKRFAFRDFFNGQDEPLPEGASPAPLLLPYRSRVHESNFTGKRTVVFSVPVFKELDSDKDPTRLGVLSMNVEVGKFTELQSDARNKGFVAVLVDTRPDREGREGAILEHPLLADLRKKNVPEKELMFFDDLTQFDKDGWCANYQDPVGESHGEFAGRWFAASHKINIDERKEAGKTGWVVIVQEKYENAVGPVMRLKNDMLRRGIWAMAIAVTLVTGLWLFVVVVLSDSSQTSFVASFKRRIGLAPDSTGSTKGSATGPQVQAKRKPAPATITEPEAPS